MFNKLQNLQEIISQHQEQIHQLQFLLQQNVKCQVSSQSTSVKQILNHFQQQPIPFHDISLRQMSSQQQSSLKNNKNRLVLNKVIKNMSLFLTELRTSIIVIKTQIQEHQKLIFATIEQQMENFKQVVYRSMKKKKMPLKELNNQNINLDLQNIMVRHEGSVYKKDKNWINDNFQSNISNDQQSQFYAKNQQKLQQYLDRNNRQLQMQKFYENIDIIKEDEAEWDEQTNTFRNPTQNQQLSLFEQETTNLQYSNEIITSTKNTMPVKLIQKVYNATKRKKSMQIPRYPPNQNNKSKQTVIMKNIYN